MTDRIVNEDDLQWTEDEHGRRTFRRKQLGAAAGGDELGTSLYELDPGKRTWPLHYHTGNEEAIYVLGGSLTLWLGPDREEYTLEAGDYVALPAGEAGAHEVETTGDDAARFLVVSTMHDPDMSIQPESRKVMLFAGSAPGGDESGRTLSKTVDLDADVEYWDAEDDP